MKMDRDHPEKVEPGIGSPSRSAGRPSRLAWALALGLAASLWAGGVPAQEKKDEAKPAPGASRGMPVEGVQAEVRTLSQEITAVGTLNANESVTIAAEIAGRVTEIAFEEGQRTAQDHVLVRLDSSIVEAQRDQAQASLNLSRANRERAEILFKQKAISQRELEEASAKWKLDEASLRLAQAQLKKTTLRAPFAGVLGLRYISLGEYVLPGQPIVTLKDTDPIKVEFSVPEIYSPRLRPGLAVQVTIDAAPDRIFRGEVHTVDPTVDPESRSLLVRAQVPNGDGTMRPGMFAQIRLVLEEKPDALMIPEEALLTRGQVRFVYKVVDGVVAEAEVKTGLRQRGLVEVTEGLSPGETVITAGQIKVRPGMPVTLLPPAQGNGR